MRKIGVVTTSRADFGIYVPLLKKIEQHPSLDLQLLVSGSHLSPEFGMTVDEITGAGFDTSNRVEILLSSDSPEGIAKSMGLGLIGFAQAYGRLRPDLLVVLGDRFEMHAAVAAALPFRIPVAHIAGGEVTEGALDDLIRHSISKLSHLHFVSTEEYGERLRQIGEESWRITVTGTPALDNLDSLKLLSKSELEAYLEMRLDQPCLLVTLHPETQNMLTAKEQADALLEALEPLDAPIIFTSPNSDLGGRVILERIQRWVNIHPHARFIPSMGIERFYSLMAIAGAMAGNSSSGIVESASFRLPVVNIGARQDGRPRGGNIIDAPFSAGRITGAIQDAMAPSFRDQLKDLVNPFGDGHASERITEVLTKVELNQRLLVKRFSNYTVEPD